MPKVTVVLPTTTDRGPLLPFSVGSVLRQTLADLELFIIGDGVNEATRQTILNLQAEDGRIRFFDHPKHPRRGEVYRHAALAEARGSIVTYLCDRDLYLPEHLETLFVGLQEYDFMSVNHFDVSPEQRISIGVKPHGYGQVADVTTAIARLGGHKLSSVGHTLAAYRALPEGWRTTPDDQATDRYMWRQFFENNQLRVYHSPFPTFLYFKRGSHPGWPTEKRRTELAAWTEIMEDPARWAAARVTGWGNLLTDYDRQHRERQGWVRVRGQHPLDFVRELPGKVRSRWRNRGKTPQW